MRRPILIALFLGMAMIKTPVRLMAEGEEQPNPCAAILNNPEVYRSCAALHKDSNKLFHQREVARRIAQAEKERLLGGAALLLLFVIFAGCLWKLDKITEAARAPLLVVITGFVAASVLGIFNVKAQSGIVGVATAFSALATSLAVRRSS